MDFADDVGFGLQGVGFRMPSLVDSNSRISEFWIVRIWAECHFLTLSLGLSGFPRLGAQGVELHDCVTRGF